MIGSLGVPELLFILVLALLVFGPRKLPELGRTMGRALGEFRRATSDLKRTLDVELSAEQQQSPSPTPTETTEAEPVGEVTPTTDSGAEPEPEPATDADEEKT